ncbi:NAD(P)-dependent alcohol dehydrogenase [Lacibacterium aquatile]|uniref:NAD(P)-dependent alcohol dehydrogenase n=1 Tax=Lacibacterium aquatile TaxID=1168082 RepID=A0ABW5DUH6_9PROT
MGNQMKQWQFGPEGRASLALAEVPVPQPGPGEALVRVKAVSLNYRDKLILDDVGYVPLGGTKVLGSDMAGEVVGLGEGAGRVALGDRVIANFGGDWIDGPSPRMVPTLGGALKGVLADYVTMPVEWLVKAPANLDDIEASTLPIAGLTAWTALVENGPVRPGQSVLVQGTGGVALFAVQIALAMGAQVIVTSSGPDKLARLQALGPVQGIDRKQRPDWEVAALELTDGRGVDHVLEMAGGDNLIRSVKAIAPGGKISLIGVIDGFSANLPLFDAFQAQATLQALLVGHRTGLEHLIQAVERIKLKPVIDSSFDFTDVPAALTRLDEGPLGKIVIRVGG